MESSVFTDRARQIHHLLRFVGAKPDGIDLLICAVCLDFGEKSVELVPQCFLFRIVLAEGKGVVIVCQPVPDIVDLRLLCVNAF